MIEERSIVITEQTALGILDRIKGLFILCPKRDLSVPWCFGSDLTVEMCDDTTAVIKDSLGQSIKISILNLHPMKIDGLLMTEQLQLSLTSNEAKKEIAVFLCKVTHTLKRILRPRIFKCFFDIDLINDEYLNHISPIWMSSAIFSGCIIVNNHRQPFVIKSINLSNMEIVDFNGDVGLTKITIDPFPCSKTFADNTDMSSIVRNQQ